MRSRVSTGDRLRVPVLLTAGLIAVAAVAGCGDIGAATWGTDDETIIRPFGPRPDQIVGELAEALEHRDAAALDAVLAPGFVFVPLEPDRFSWLFDPGWTGADPAVLAVELDFTVLDLVRPDEQTIELITDWVLALLTGPDNGWSLDARFRITLVRTPDRALRIARMEEVLR